MTPTIFTAIVLLAPPAKATEAAKPDTPKKAPVSVAELLFKRMDSNKDNSISLKEFKDHWEKQRQAPSRFGRGRSSGRQGGSSGQRGRSGGRDRGSRGSSRVGPKDRPKPNS